MLPVHTLSTVRLPALVLTTLTITLPTTTHAWYYVGTGYGGHGYYGHGHHYSQGYNYGRHAYRDRYQYRSSSVSRQHGIGSGGCHPTSKIGYYDGYKGKVGGTMCYDDYGEPYIVSGSRYLIEEY